ncbi:chitin deacetylase [Sticta canariensis]|nr:chitin deacetylase [Sticta canariensis]
METDIVVILPTTVEITASRTLETAPLQSWPMVAHADPNSAADAARLVSVVHQGYVSAMCDGHGLEAELATQGYCGTTKEFCSDPDCQFKYGTCDSDTTPTGASTLSGYRPLLGQVPYNSDIFECIEDNVVALTYDDGPYLYTSQLLDILKQFGWHATFFVTGNNLGKGPIDTTAPYPDLLRRMVAEGHQVASHTWSHYSLDEITSDMRKQQMAKNERAIANVIGKYPTYMRPPYSQCATAACTADMQALGYHRVYFDLDTTDYLNPLPSMIQKAKDVVNAALLDKSSPNYLSIQHDIVEQSVTTLTTYFYNLIRSRGWKGVTVGECLQDPQQNWYRAP